MRQTFLLLLALCFCLPSHAQRKKKKTATKQILPVSTFNADLYKGLKFRNIGPFRGGRSVAVSGVIGDPMTYYMGSTGGGIWKTEDAGISWHNISDGQLKTGSVGAIAVDKHNPNIVYVGMGEHPIRGVMTSHGDGVYKSTDAGKTWKHVGLEKSRHIAAVRIHPQNPDIVYVAVQGAAYGANVDRGVYKTIDGGQSWKKVLYIDDNTGAADLSMDSSNPAILYAGMWEHRRYPWHVKSGGPGSSIHKSMDGGATWTKLSKGLPPVMGKVAVDVSPANSKLVFANIEAEGEKGGVYRSDDGGESWKQTSKDRITIARSWYYTEIFAHPTNENEVYVLNAPVLKSIDGGKTFKTIAIGHGDQHDMWVNPANPKNMIVGNDGGATVTFNGGKTWSAQDNQPTVQFYRVIADNQFPYHVYGGQQDNSTVAIASRAQGGISWKDWYPVAGGESAFIAFDPDNPELIYGGTYHGIMSVYDSKTKMRKDIMAYPVIGLGMVPKDMKYRFNWNSPIVASPQDYSVMYHGGNKVLKTSDGGLSWEEISPDLTRNDKSKQGPGGIPFTIEGAGGENYNTISYLQVSKHSADVLWVGTDDGLVHVTKDGGKNWTNVTPSGIGESLINAIEVSPHDAGTAYIAVTKYKFNDFTPLAYVTTDYGATWKKITNGIAKEDYVRVVRADPKRQSLLYAGTETGLYISFNNGQKWQKLQLNLPVCPINDMTFADNDLVIATSGRGFWILDDLSALQQASTNLGNQKEVQIFQPKPTVRISFSSRGREAIVGKNPPSGVLIDYFLPMKVDTNDLKLEVFHQDGTLLRSYTNIKDKKFKVYPGGPRPAKVLPTKKGINRFAWDLRTASTPGVQGVFVNGTYQGAMVAPGTYTLRLTANGQVSETKATIIPDPRLDASPADYAAQQAIVQQIDAAVIEVHQSVNRMRKVKKQVNNLNSLLKEMEGVDSLQQAGKAVAQKISDWEEALIQRDQKTFQDVINFPNRLNSHFMNLKRKVDAHDPRVTKGAQQRLADLQAQWAQHKATLDSIINTDVAGFNQLFKEMNVPALILPKE